MPDFIIVLLDTANMSLITFLLFNLLLVRKNKSIFVYLILFSLNVGFTHFSYVYNLLPAFKTAVIMASVMYLFKGTIPNRILAVAFLFQLGVILDFLHGFVVFINLPVNYHVMPNGQGSFIEILIQLILISLNYLRRGKEPLINYFDKKYVLVWLLITLNAFLSFSIISSLEFSSQMKGLISTILILTSGINLYFCYYLEKTRKIFEENIVISRQAEFQESKLEQNKAYLEKNNRLMHDIKRHYLEIEQALSENQLDYVKEYMKGVYQQYFDNSGTGFTGNQVVDSMFFSLKEQCQKEKIELDYSISITKRIELDEKDLAVILGGLFDKAVKMASQTEQEPLIKAEMRTDQHHLVITVQHPKELKTVGTKGMIQQWEESQMIHRIVEKYHGMYEIVEEPELSGTKIILPISQKNKK